MTHLVEPKRPIPMEGWGKRHLRKTMPPEPGEVFGNLTAVERLGPTSTYTRYRCACGSEVVRMHADVRKAVRCGRTPACLDCNNTRRGKATAAARRKEQP